MARWDIPVRAMSPSDAQRIRDLETMLEVTERERAQHAQAWSDAQRQIIQLKAENARLRAGSSFLRAVR